jgi:hypothetical protein
VVKTVVSGQWSVVSKTILHIILRAAPELFSSPTMPAVKSLTTDH